MKPMTMLKVRSHPLRDVKLDRWADTIAGRWHYRQLAADPQWRHGWLWATCAETRAWDERLGRCPIRLFKYYPDEDAFVWFDHDLARRADRDQLCPDPGPSTAEMPDMSESRHKEDHGFCDSMLYDGGRFIYAGSVAGVLSRIDIETGQVVKVATVMLAGRFPAMAWGPDGRLYGGGGMLGQTTLCRFDPRTLALEAWPVPADQSGERPARVHELCVADDGTVYLGENDHHARSSYLWAVRFISEETRTHYENR